MNLALIEAGARWAGGLLTLATLSLIFHGIWRGTGRPAGTGVGWSVGLLRSPLFYLLASSLFFGVCVLLWRPIPVSLSAPGRLAALIFGSLLFFPDLGLAVWGRLALGRMYFVSTGMGAQLFADHRLVTHGPYAIVRHPMYVGLSVAMLGGLLLYQTWTWVALLLLPLGLWRRAGREEQALAAGFGEAWQAYCRRVPAFVPRLWPRFRSGSG
jgi:protein-S-isoprenylcysteine O-methyltransferase Ste14